MRKLYIICFAVFSTLCLQAQQQAQYSRFLSNKLTLNPAYAGSKDGPCINCTHRSQWVGLDGAPSSQALNFHMPMLSDKIGVGAIVTHDKIGPTNIWHFGMTYAYRIKIKQSFLAIGIEGMLKGYNVNFMDTNPTHSGDRLVTSGASESKVFPDFGAGLYFHNTRYFAGLSFKNFMKENLSFSETTPGTSDFSQETIHAYLIAGIVFRLNSGIRIKPAFLLKAARHAPISTDINVTAIFFDKLWAGVNMRMGGSSDSESRVKGESFGLLLQLQVTPSIKAGVAYDYTLSKLRDFNSGSYELGVEYCIDKGNKRYANPRFF